MTYSPNQKKPILALLLIAVCCLWELSVLLETAVAENHGRGRKQNRLRDGSDSSIRSETIIIPPDSPQLMNLKTEVVGTAPIPGQVITAPGRIVLDPNRVSRILMPAPGRIDCVLVRLGDRITPGQLLLMVDSPDAVSAVAECRKAEAAEMQMRSSLIKAEADRDRAVDLYDHQAIARKEVLAAEYELAQAGASLEHAKTDLAHCRRRLEILGLRPNETEQKLPVRAALGGKVIDLSVAAGEYRSDTNTPLMMVADLDTVLVTSEIPEISIRFIEVGEEVQVELVAYPREAFDARVIRIADTVDPKTRTIQVLAELPNPRGRLRPEMFGRIRHSHAPTLLPVVPAQAIVQTPRGSFVFVERGEGRFERIPIQPGEPIAVGVPVLGGIKEGDRIVVRGNMLLIAGGTH